MKKKLFKVDLTEYSNEDDVIALLANHPELVVRNHLKLSSYTLFANILRTNETIQTLKIVALPGFQYFFETGIVQLLLITLKSNKSLKSLQMTNCKIGNEEAKDVADLMITHDTITNYNFSINRIGNDGAAIIADAMSQNKVLKSLNLEFNCIAGEGLTKIAEALNNCPSIRELNINLNSMTKPFQCLILKTIVDHPSLTSLDIDDIVGKCSDIYEEVHTLLQFNKKICQINFFIGFRRGYIGYQEKDNAINENINNNKQYTPLASALFNKEYNSQVLNNY
jgi:Ran GTPase-activating protein (RanGAP) involved in mRNA processing and transport